MKKSKSLFNPFMFRHVRSTKGKHAFANSRLRLCSQKLLRASDYEKLLGQDSADDILKVLSDQYDYPLSFISSIKEELSVDQQATLRFISRSIGNHRYGKPTTSPVEEYLFLPLDFFHLKVLSKGQLDHRTWNQLPFSTLGFLSLQNLESLYQGKPLGFLHPYLKESIRKYYQLAESQKTPFFLDVFWDNELHKAQESILKSLQSEIITTLHRTKLDIKNILGVLRLKKAGKSEQETLQILPYLGDIRRDILMSLFHAEWENIANILSSKRYGKEVAVGMETFKETGNFSSLEKHLEEFWLYSCYRFISLTYEEDLAIIYHWLKQNEHRNIQTVISGKQNKMDDPWILSHLRIFI